MVFVGDADDLRKAVGVAPAASPAPDAVQESTTEHKVVIAGQAIPYRATAGTMTVGLEDEDQPKGRLFYVAYQRTDVADPTKRPVTFCFNGGPGSSAVWLHMGLFGPRRVRIDADAVPRPAAVAEDNDRSLLDVTDLVFVDPMSTGYSRPEKGPGDPYHTVDADVQSVGDFVRRWTTKNGRWGSPKLVAGESYGTTRAAALARHLQSRHGLFLNGLVLVSVALKFQTLLFDDGNDLPYVLYVPAYAATAAFHGKVKPGRDLQAFLKRAETWAYDRFLPALSRGAHLPDDERLKVANELAAFVGLDAQYILRCNLRVDLFRFCRELLRDQRKTVGRLDSRFVGFEKDAAGEKLENDPSMPALMGAYASAFHHDLEHRLKYRDDEVYEFLNLKANEAWKWDRANRYLDVTSDLRQAMLDNAHLGVFAASGLYDLATPIAATDYTIAHLGLEPSQRDQVVHHTYPAGHMMYVHEPSLDQLRSDLLAFYATHTA
jgi:carboxypeptidase C (cathepsin A)